MITPQKLRLLKAAAEKGSWKAQGDMGEVYFSGLAGEPIDYMKSAESYNSCLQGIIASSFRELPIIDHYVNNLAELFRSQKIAPSQFPPGLETLQLFAKKSTLITPGQKLSQAHNSIRIGALLGLGLAAYDSRDREKAAKYYRRVKKIYESAPNWDRFPVAKANGMTAITNLKNLHDPFGGAFTPSVPNTLPKTTSIRPGPLPLLECNACKKGDIAMSVCSRCKSVRYCNQTCQKQDWPTHKKVCKAPA